MWIVSTVLLCKYYIYTLVFYLHTPLAYTGSLYDFDRKLAYRGTDVVLVCFAVHDPWIGRTSFENVSEKVLCM